MLHSATARQKDGVAMRSSGLNQNVLLRYTMFSLFKERKTEEGLLYGYLTSGNGTVE